MRPFEVKLEILNDKAIWTTREINDVNLARVKALHEDGLTVREIADETGIPKSTVQRLKKKMRQMLPLAEVSDLTRYPLAQGAH